MAWARIDDAIIDHPKVLEAGEDARDLLIVSIIWCNKHLTDGRVPKAALGILSRKKSAKKNAEALVRVGLWHDEGDAWQLHDYLDWNPSKKEVEEKRNASAERMRKSRERRAKKAGATNAQVAPKLQRNTRATDASVAAPTPLHSLTTTPLPPAGGGFSEDSELDEAAEIAGRVTARIVEITGRPYPIVRDLERRVRAGTSEEELLRVVEFKAKDPFFQERHYARLKPSTLFGPKFPEYLADATQAKPAESGPEYRDLMSEWD